MRQNMSNQVVMTADIDKIKAEIGATRGVDAAQAVVVLLARVGAI